MKPTAESGYLCWSMIKSFMIKVFVPVIFLPIAADMKSGSGKPEHHTDKRQ